MTLHVEVWNSTFKNIDNRLHAHGNQLLLCKTVIKLFWASGNRLLPYGNRLPESKNSGKRFFFEKFFWTNCAILFSSSPSFLQKAFQETYSWALFSREGLLGCKHWTQGTNVPWVHCKKLDLLLGWSLDTKDQHFLGSLQEVGITSWLLSLDTRDQRSLGFIARSGNNFLVVIT